MGYPGITNDPVDRRDDEFDDEIEADDDQFDDDEVDVDIDDLDDDELDEDFDEDDELGGDDSV